MTDFAGFEIAGPLVEPSPEFAGTGLQTEPHVQNLTCDGGMLAHASSGVHAIDAACRIAAGHSVDWMTLRRAAEWMRSGSVSMISAAILPVRPALGLGDPSPFGPLGQAGL